MSGEWLVPLSERTASSWLLFSTVQVIQIAVKIDPEGRLARSGNLVPFPHSQGFRCVSRSRQELGFRSAGVGSGSTWWNGQCCRILSCSSSAPATDYEDLGEPSTSLLHIPGDCKSQVCQFMQSPRYHGVLDMASMDAISCLERQTATVQEMGNSYLFSWDTLHHLLAHEHVQ